jgi:hypothetical protein
LGRIVQDQEDRFDAAIGRTESVGPRNELKNIKKCIGGPNGGLSVTAARAKMKLGERAIVPQKFRQGGKERMGILSRDAVVHGIPS